MTTEPAAAYGERVTWRPATPRIGVLRLLVSAALLTVSVYVAAAIVPGVTLERPGAAVVVAAMIARAERAHPAGRGRPAAPVHGCRRLPARPVRRRRAAVLAAELLPDWIRVGSFGDALLAALVIAAVAVVLRSSSARTTTTSTRCASPGGSHAAGAPHTDATCPAMIFLEIDGLALPVLPTRCATAARRTWRGGSPRTGTG